MTIYRIAAHVEVGRVVLSQIYVVGQQFAFALCLDPQEGSPCGCVVGALLLLGGDSQHFAPAVFRQEERARRLAVLVRCHRRQFGGAQLPGLLILRKQRGDACHIHHLHGLQLQVVIGPVEGDVTDDFGHIAPNGDRNALRFRPDRTGRPAGHGQRSVVPGHAELIGQQRPAVHRAHIFVQVGHGIHLVFPDGDGTRQHTALHVEMLRPRYPPDVVQEDVDVLHGLFVRGPRRQTRPLLEDVQREPGLRPFGRPRIVFGTAPRQCEQR